MEIESYAFGQIVIEGQSYSNDVIVFPDHLKTNWWRREGHELHPADLEDVLEAAPEILVVGTGNSGRMRVLDETARLLQERSIELVAQPTTEACRRYNELERSGRDAVAALHLTC